MRTKSTVSVLLGLLGLALFPLLAAPIPISGLCNTGVNVVGGIDQCYTLPDDAPVYLVTSAYPFFSGGGAPLWLANGADSSWIGVQAAYSLSGPGDADGNYYFRTGFNLPAETDLTTVQITGFWASDNAGVDILLNGVGTGNQIPFGTYPDLSFQALHAFTITAGLPVAGLGTASFGFRPGWNTLDFVVDNPSGYPCCDATGLRVSSLEGTFALIPEPSTLLLLGSGFAGLILLRRRR